MLWKRPTVNIRSPLQLSEAHTLSSKIVVPTDMSLAEMDEIWNEAKKAERAEDAETNEKTNYHLSIK